MSEEILMRFEGLADRVIPADMFGTGWPMPDLLAHFPLHDAWVIPADDMPLDPDVVTFYRKISESQITDEEIVKMTHVMRGAQYEKVAQ